MSPTEAELYAALHRGNAGDMAFYESCCRQRKRILEMGSGYGRVANALARHGHEVTGVEQDGGLIDLALEALERAAPIGKPRFVQDDMCAVDLGAKFDAVIIPYSGLYCLLDDAAVHACLRNAHRHLEPGGLLCLDAYYADAFHAESEPEHTDPTELSPVVSFTHGADSFTVFERSDWLKGQQRIDAHYEYFDAHGALAHTGSIQQRYLLVEQLESHVASAGFNLLESLADFRREAPNENTETLALVAERLV